MMRAGNRRGIRRATTTVLAALMLALALPAGPAQAQLQLTKQQAADIDQVATNVQATLLAGGTSAQDAQHARLAIRATMIAVTYKTGDTQSANALAGSVLDPYIKPAGSVTRDLTAAEQAAVSNVRSTVKNLVAPVLPTPDADAVAFTAGLAATNTIKAANPDPWVGSGITADKWVASQGDQDLYPLVVPFASLPPLTDPTSPFNPAATHADGPVPQPVVSSAPPSLPLNPNVDSKVNPDGSVTELTFGPNGPITRTRVPGGPADPPWQDANQAQSTASSSGATQLEVVEEDLSAGQNNNQGNTKNRTGSDDGKKDEDKQDNGGGGNGNSNSSGGHPK